MPAMKCRAPILLALAAAAVSRVAFSTESTCADTSDIDETHEVSMLQTEIRVSRSHQAPAQGPAVPSSIGATVKKLEADIKEAKAIIQEVKQAADPSALQSASIPLVLPKGLEEELPDGPLPQPVSPALSPVAPPVAEKTSSTVTEDANGAKITVTTKTQDANGAKVTITKVAKVETGPRMKSETEAKTAAASKEGKGNTEKKEKADKKDKADSVDGEAAEKTSDATMHKGAISTKVAITLALTALGLLIAAVALSSTVEEIAGTPTILARCLAEFVGTFMLIFSVGCNVLVGDKTWGVTAIACTLMVSIYALGGVSGANFNPAVSVALGLSRKMSVQDVAIYVCVQLAGGIYAALCYGLMLGETFNLAPADGFTWVQAGFAELIYTFMLTFVVLNVAASSKDGGKNEYYGLAIGFSVIAGGYGAGSVSGGCFNPAVAVAIDAASSSLGFGWCFAYIGFQLAGCALASALFRVCRQEDFGDIHSRTLSKLTSEFIGTYMLVLTVGLNVLSKSKAGAFSIAACLMSMIFALGSCSGAHFNPAVTLAITCCERGFEWLDAACYVSAQLVGAMLAALTYVWMMNGKTVPLAPAATIQQAEIGEFAFTFLLSFVVLAVATVRKPLGQFFGLAIGACIIAGGYAIGNLSGGSLNPAVSVALAIPDYFNGGGLGDCFLYVLAELIGGTTAAGLFKITHASEFVETAKNGK